MENVDVVIAGSSIAGRDGRPSQRLGHLCRTALK